MTALQTIPVQHSHTPTVLNTMPHKLSLHYIDYHSPTLIPQVLNTIPSLSWQHPNYDCLTDCDSPTLTPTVLNTMPSMSWQHPKLSLHYRLSVSNTRTHQQFSTPCQACHDNTLNYHCTTDYHSRTLAHTNSSQHHVKHTMTTLCKTYHDNTM